MIALTVTASHGVQWVRQAALWRSVMTTGVHPSNGKAHDRATAKAAHRDCLAFGRRSRVAALPQAERPCASYGLRSYRARSPYGVIMIGARNAAEAMREAYRSSSSPHSLERWTGCGWAPERGA